MKIIKGNESILSKPIGRLTSTNYIHIYKADAENDEQERFDKNNLSEADMDEILAYF